MTRWRRFGWALGYTLMTAYGVFLWIAATEANLYHYFGATSLIYGLGLGAFSENEIIGTISFFNFLLILAGLVIVPVLTAFRLRVPLYVLMGLDVLGRVVLLVNKALERDTYLIGHVIAGLLVSIALLAGTVGMFRQPDVPPKEEVVQEEV